MTETISLNQWQNNSGHYVDFDDNAFYPMTTEKTIDLKRSYDDFFEDFSMSFETDYMSVDYEDKFVPEEREVPGIQLEAVPVASQEMFRQQQMNAYYAQQAIAVGIAQQAQQYYYNYPQCYKMLQDGEISAQVYSRLNVKKDAPFENVNRVLNDNHHEIVRPKKRMRKTVDLPPVDHFNNLMQYKEALNSLDSISFENYISEVSNNYRFSASENEEIRAIRGRIKNREAARKSRMKKKNKPMVLEDTVRELLTETTELEHKLGALKQERVEMYNEMSFLSNTISTLLGNKDFAEQYRNFYESMKLNQS